MKTDTNPLSVLDPLLIDELADYLGVPIKTIYEWRQSGRGPVGIRMGRHLKFRRVRRARLARREARVAAWALLGEGVNCRG